VTVEAIKQASPLDGWANTLPEVPGAIQIREVPFLAQVNVRLKADGPAGTAAAEVLGVRLPVTPCTAAAAGDLQILWLGPDEWLVVGPPGTAGELVENMRAALGGQGTVCDVSAQRTTLSVSGPRAADVLAHGCAIDLDPRAAPAGTCVQTSLARVGVILVVHDGAASSLWLLVRSSFAAYLATWLTDACQEYAGDPS
jgi:sarcosine oxidase subunit gamma